VCTALLAASGHLGNIPAPWECEGTAAWPYPLLWHAPLPLGLRVRMVTQPRATGKGRARGPCRALHPAARACSGNGDGTSTRQWPVRATRSTVGAPSRHCCFDIQQSKACAILARWSTCIASQLRGSFPEGSCLLVGPLHPVA